MKRPAVVIWNDAHATLDELTEPDIAGAHRPTRIQTVGYIVRSDEIGVSIAAEWIPAADGSDERYRGITFVPRAMVLEERSRRRRPKPATAADAQ